MAALSWPVGPQDDDLVSVLSSSLTSSAHTLVSASSSASTDVMSYLESLKNFSEWSEEAKSIQRLVASRELRRQAIAAREAADAWDAKLQDRRRTLQRTEAEDVVAQPEACHCASIATMDCLPECALSGQDLCNRRLQLYRKDPGPSYYWAQPDGFTTFEEDSGSLDEPSQDLTFKSDAKAEELEAARHRMQRSVVGILSRVAHGVAGLRKTANTTLVMTVVAAVPLIAVFSGVTVN
mmetsp:Transcript_22153/g.63524  ORF Transcript_22153/g.63524 Transcript_22153/m.63524 type:complete len:237 (+) Transcript_22153:78-788(+)